MATTAIANIIEPTLFDEYVRLRTAELSAFFTSGAIVTNEKMTAYAQGGGQYVDLPFWNAISDADESAIADDDPAQLLDTKGITASKQMGIINYRQQAWSAEDLASMVAGSDAIGAIVEGVAQYWANQYNRFAIAALKGIRTDNVTNDSADMTVDGGASPASLTVNQILTAQQTAGDRGMRGFTLIAMHSQAYLALQAANLIDFIPDARGEVNFATFQGLSVVVDDSLIDATILLGPGSLLWGEGSQRVPVEFDRTPAAGGGTGTEELYTRKKFILHPNGFAIQSGGVSGRCPTNTELEAAAAWDRVVKPQAHQHRVHRAPVEYR